MLNLQCLKAPKLKYLQLKILIIIGSLKHEQNLVVA